MFKELNKYKQQGHFFFKPTDNLADVCNAPKEASGIYLIYALEKGKVNLIYIGISGREVNGVFKHRKDGLRGRFLTGKTKGLLRKIYWPQKMKEEGIDALDVYWYVTYSSQNQDLPRDVEVDLLLKYRDVFGELPRWNSKI